MFVRVNPAIFSQAPWKDFTPAQQASFHYCIDHSAAGSTQNVFYPRPTAGGTVNALPKLSGQSGARSISIGVNGEHLDSYMFKQVFMCSDQSSWGGMLVVHMADAITRGILIATRENGTVITAQNLLDQDF